MSRGRDYEILSNKSADVKAFGEQYNGVIRSINYNGRRLNTNQFSLINNLSSSVLTRITQGQQKNILKSHVELLLTTITNQEHGFEFDSNFHKATGEFLAFISELGYDQYKIDEVNKHFGLQNKSVNILDDAYNKLSLEHVAFLIVSENSKIATNDANFEPFKQSMIKPLIAKAKKEFEIDGNFNSDPDFFQFIKKVCEQKNPAAKDLLIALHKSVSLYNLVNTVEPDLSKITGAEQIRAHEQNKIR